jgi:hypothetical protein
MEQCGELAFEVDGEVLVLQNACVAGLQCKNGHKGSFLGHR